MRARRKVSERTAGAASATATEPPSTAPHSNSAENEPYRLKHLGNAVPTLAMLSVARGQRRLE